MLEHPADLYNVHQVPMRPGVSSQKGKFHFSLLVAPIIHHDELDFRCVLPEKQSC